MNSDCTVPVKVYEGNHRATLCTIKPSRPENQDNCCDQLQSVLDKAPKRDIAIVMGDMNVKVDNANTERESSI